MPGRSEVMNMKDHDMLVTLNTKMDGVVVDIKDLKDGLSTRMGAAEVRIDVLEKRTNIIDPISLPRDLERIRALEDRARWVGWLLAPIYIGLIGFLVGRFTGLFD